MDGSKVSIKNVVKTWVSTTEKIKKMSAELRELRKSEKEMKGEVKNYMENNDTLLIELKKYDVVYEKKKSTASLSKDFLSESMSRFFAKQDDVNDALITDKLMQHLWSEKKDMGKEKTRVLLKPLKGAKTEAVSAKKVKKKHSTRKSRKQQHEDSNEKSSDDNVRVASM